MGDSFIFDDDDSRQSSFTDMPEGDMSEGGDDGSPGGSNNRTFLIAAGVIGGVILLALLCMAGYVFFMMPRQNAGQAAQQTAVLLTNTAIAGNATSTAAALMATSTLDPGSIAATAQAVAATRQMDATRTAEALAALASPTPVVMLFTATPIMAESPTPDPVTETVAALYTQAALAELTVYPTSTELGAVPTTGFADEVGLPGLFIIGFVLVVIILLSRRLRSNPEAR